MRTRPWFWCVMLAFASAWAQSPPPSSLRRPGDMSAPASALSRTPVPEQRALATKAAPPISAAARESMAAEPLTAVAPNKAALENESRALRTEQDRLAAEAKRARTHVIDNVGPAPHPTNTATPYAGRVFVPAEEKNRLGIFAVNGRIVNMTLTPGGKVIVWGAGFGTAPSAVRIVGGALERNPVLLQIDWWAQDEIDAVIPYSVRGVPDEPKAVVEVRTVGGATYRFEGVSFVAAREAVSVTDDTTIKTYASVTYGHPAPNRIQFPLVDREANGGSIDCMAPGSDGLEFRSLRGFVVTHITAVHGRTDSGDGDENGDAGSRVFTPGYGFGTWYRNVVEYRWGVFRSHSTHAHDPYQWHDHCSSKYKITSLTLFGPAGVAP